ncbi:MAG: polysaccharide biosynthesis protein [Proteobacteria bacterium]|nr:polysaccharide biosynthesis protein [Pseudomonadota bacterium]
MLRQALAWPRRVKQLVAVTLDLTLGLLAMWLAFSLRLDTLHWPEGLQWLVYGLGPLMALPVFVHMGLYRAIFRYNGIAALLTTGRAVALYGALLLALLLLAKWEGVPRSVGMLQPLILLLLVGASRALGWLWFSGRARNARYRLLIYGAGVAGAQTAAGLASARQYALRGFIDDDSRKVGSNINGIRVYASGTLPDLVAREAITDVLLALPSAAPERRRAIIRQLAELPVRIRTLPSLTDLASGRVSVTDFQDLDIVDLLGRAPVAPDQELLARNLQGAVVLVTGAGGSIGGELCRQLLQAQPARLLLLDHSEYALYSIHQELQASLAVQAGADETARCTLVPLLANVTDEAHIAHIFEEWRPQSVYHAAAYKHVPMVEANAAQGVLNNVFGTLSVVRAAIRHGARHFVLISTDKAVRPTNVMGASKRIAEQVLQALAPQGGTCFSMVRFGNVLGSSGSVIPLFRRQIAAGGPVTVTHPDVTRYFMTIPEAAQLVLQAGAMAQGGDLFLLDMGESMRIADLARRMVALSGLTVRSDEHPEGDIAIRFTGLRPGEKLYEELLIGDNPMPTAHPRILRAREAHASWEELQPALEALRQAALADDGAALKAWLQRLVAGYQPAEAAQA